MASPPIPDITIAPHDTFTVSSGSLCFGSIQDIWDGAAAATQTFPHVRPQRDGTIKLHHIEHNVVAQNGVWNVYQLVSVETGVVTAWFAARDNVAPWQEVDRILRISGSPYEPDSGDSMNTARTTAEGLFVINRYDWCRRRTDHEIGGNGYDISQDTSHFRYATWTGLVDKEHARETVLQWQAQPGKLSFSSVAASFYIPGGEYDFGRFMFDDQRHAARSFIYFTTHTVFTSTTFAGQIQPLRVEETDEEYFSRLIREGRDVSGVGTIQSLTAPPEDPSVIALYEPPPPTSELLGPFDTGEYILSGQHIEDLRVESQTGEPIKHNYRDANRMVRTRLIPPFLEYQFEPTWEESIRGLVNELALTFVTKFIVHIDPENTISSAAETLFPQHNAPEPQHDNIDHYAYQYFINPGEKPIPSLSIAEFAERMNNFTSHRLEAQTEFHDGILRGASRTLAYFLTELLELAGNMARDLQRPKITPQDIRLCLVGERSLLPFLGHSRVLWEGGRLAQRWT